MHAFLLAVFLTGPIAMHGADRQPVVEQRHTECDQQPAAIILVVDGSSQWPGQAANEIVAEFQAMLGPCHALQVARFDAEPVLQHGISATGVNRDLVVVRPRTPMREAMEAGFARLIDVPSPHAMVVIAHEQFYPTSVSQGRLVELARRSETTVHAIHLASSRAQGGVFRRLRRWLGNGIVWLIETLALEERGYSARDTAHLLKIMADATGGRSCTAADEQTRITCAKYIADAIVSGPP